MSRTGRLWVVLLLNLLMVGGLVVVGISAGSLGVFAEGVDYLADAAAIAVSLLAVWLSRRPPTATRPHGYPRATTLAALVNGGWLLVLCLLVMAGALDRLVTGVHAVRGLQVLIVSGTAAAVMLAGAILLGRDEPDAGDDEGASLNMRAVLLDTAADAAAAAGVAVTGGIILATDGLYWLDPSVALVTAAAVAYHAVRLLRRVVGTLGYPCSPLEASAKRRTTRAGAPIAQRRCPRALKAKSRGA